MTFLKTQYAELGKIWRGGYGAEVRRTAVSFAILIGLGFGLCLALPELRNTVIGYIVNLFSSMPIMDETGQLSATFLFSSNLQTCTIMMLCGLLPFLRLPALPLGVNAMLLGVLAAHYLANRLSMGLYFAALLPHAVFELPAMVLALAMGLFVCRQMTGRFRKEESAISLMDCFTHISRLLLGALVPLLAAAAIMEAYVTPLFVSYFQ